MSDADLLNFQSGDWCAGSRYAIVKLIARGGMAEVYEALDLVGKKRCAVKISQLRHQHNDALTEKMAAEARALQEFSHPNLVRVFEAGLDHGTFYFVMELLDGKTLRDILHAEGALPLERALDWVSQVADAVHQLNEVGIVHRDLKPENILIAKLDATDDGPGSRVPKVLDLGVAKFKRYGLKSTAIGDQMGTAAYMSPEHIRGDKDLDRRADVYALGHILYECILGRHAFMDAGAEMPSFVDFTTWQLHRVPVPLVQLVAGLPPAVSALADRALQKDREQRPPSAGAFAKELRIELEKLRPKRHDAVPATPGGVVSDRTHGASDEAPVTPPSLSPTPSPAVRQKRTSKGTEMMLTAPLGQAPGVSAPTREPVASELPRADAARPAPPPPVSPSARASAPPLWAAVVVALAVSLVLVTGVAVALRLRRSPTATLSSADLPAASAAIATAASAAVPEPATTEPATTPSASASAGPAVPTSPNAAMDAGAAPSLPSPRDVPPRATAVVAAPGPGHMPPPAKPAAADRPFAGEPVF